MQIAKNIFFLYTHSSTTKKGSFVARLSFQGRGQIQHSAFWIVTGLSVVDAKEIKTAK